jgi:iron(III) transport system substrate-binding protein
MGQKLAVLVALLLVLSLPFLVRGMAGGGGPSAPEAAKGAPKLVIVTPHVEQIRSEFGAAFERWHLRTQGTAVTVDWRAPGGTADIMKQLEATLEAAANNGQIDDKGVAKPGSAGFDLFFGGGSFEHGKMKEEKKVRTASGKTITFRMGQPANFEKEKLVAWFGEKNKIGEQFLYDPEQFWIGTALSGFGIVYNRDVLKNLGLPEPRSFGDLCDYRMFNMVALADGRQSGSVTTTYDSILNKEGWDKGWRTLREMCANARYFASSSTKPPIDVSQGEAAAGMAIDFYGRSQAQMLMKPGMDPKSVRVGYVDPEGAVYIDADPASILNGTSNFELAKKFVEFCLTEEAQALWQFHSVKSVMADHPRVGGGDGTLLKVASDYPKTPDGRLFGPDEYELRRMPVRPVMYEKYSKFMVDQVNPFKIASDVPQRGWRSAIAPLMAAFGIDVVAEIREAWRDLNMARLARASNQFPTDKLDEMERLFYAMPMHTMKDGTQLEFNEKNYKAIKTDTNSWKDLDHGKRALIGYTASFRENYTRVTAIWRANSGGVQ